jgi:mannosyltransferase
MKYLKTNNLFLIALILVGAIIRFWNIGFQHMTCDEEFTIGFAGVGITAGQIFIQSLSQDFTPPLYYLAAHFSMILFGETAEAIRYPSAIAGILLIPVMYSIGRGYKDELFGLMLAGSTTIFYNFIYYSRYGRSYSLALLFFSIAFYYFMRLLKGDKKSSIPFGIFALLCVWTHLYTAIPLGVMILYLLWEQKVYYHGLAITVIGSLPLLNYFTLINSTRALANSGWTSLPIHHL